MERCERDKMVEIWGPIENFPDYNVSSYGNVVDLRTDKVKNLTKNYQGIIKVNIEHDGVWTTRSVAVLVAKAFVFCDQEEFDTLIHFDGDKSNCHVDNLAWRPRWFAIKYHRQFSNETFNNFTGRIAIHKSDESFIGFKDPSIKYGLLWTSIRKSCIEGGPVFPINQEFFFID
jgi:hypothetical protein